MSDLAAVTAALRAIEEMALHLASRAVDRSNARDMPGGDALVNLAPVASPRRWAAQFDAYEREALAADESLKDSQPDLSHEDPDDLWPASELLTWWSEDYRQRLGMTYEGWRPTLVSEAKFLRNHDVAEWIWNNEAHWSDYAADVERAKAKLENILHEGDRSERTAVVCDRCDDGRRLIRVWGDEPDQDRWKCPGCKHLFTDAELDDALATQMRRSKPREWIPRNQAVDLLRSLGHQERVAARLVDHPDTEGWRDETTHVRWVRWPAAWRRHLSEMQRRRMKTQRSEDLSA